MTRTILVVAALLTAGVAHAGEYRWPTTYGVAVTAHYDNNHGSGAPLDWMCGGNSYSGHDGTDIGVARFTNVFAGAGGWVKQSADGYGEGYLGSTDGGGFGNHVAIFHGGGDETIYGHLSAGTGIPAAGTTLACADPIGQSGNSGNSTGPHLHFETRVGVDEFGSYYSGAADDPYAGACSGPLSYWTNQDGGTPTTDCAAGDPPAPFDDAAWVADVTYPDGAHVVDGVPFEKIWRVRNSGTSSWGAGFQLIHVEGPSFAAPPADVAADPGAEIEIALTMTATGGGTQRSTWRMAHDGVPFGESIWVEVVVDPRPADDADGDGYGVGSDCDDADAAVHPGAAETCDGLDNDCSGAADEGLVRACERSCGTGTEVCAGGAFTACDLWCPGDPIELSALDEAGDARGVAGGCSAAGSRGAGGLLLTLIALSALLLARGGRVRGR